MKRIVRFCIIALVSVVLVSCSSFSARKAETFTETKEAAQQVGMSLVADPSVASAVSIAVMYEGQIIYSEGFGMRNAVLGLPADSATRFNIGSISKVFISTSILLLEQDGLLDLDDKVFELFPGFSMADERYRDITVRMLLDHASGMPGTLMRNAFTDFYFPEYLDQAMEGYAFSYLKHNPGDFSPYCNDGFTVAQALVEHLSGMSYSEFLQQRIFNPLLMADTSVGFSPLEANMAFGYAGPQAALPLEYVNIQASGGLTSTSEDLCRFAAMLSFPQLLGAEALDEFLTEQKSRYTEDTSLERLLSYGLGWDFTFWEPYRSEGVQVLGKTGGTLQYTTMLFALPESQSAVVLLSSGHINPIGAALPIVDALLKETKQIPRKAKASPPEIKTKPVLNSEIGIYSGYYGSASGVCRLGLNEDASVLSLEFYEDSDFAEAKTARHIGGGIYENAEGTWYAFEKLKGVPSLMEIHKPYNQAEIVMTRLEEKPFETKGAFSEGKYLVVNFHPDDLYFPVFTLGFIDELASYLTVDDVPYAITAERQASMVLPALRDQSPIQLDAQGHLLVGSYECINADEVVALTSGESIMAGGSGPTVWRRIGEQGTFTCTVPQGARVIVLGPDLADLEDTLYSTENQLSLDIFGSYVAFMAKEPVVFTPTILSKEATL